jgi:hypothetical protein
MMTDDEASTHFLARAVHYRLEARERHRSRLGYPLPIGCRGLGERSQGGKPITRSVLDLEDDFDEMVIRHFARVDHLLLKRPGR